MEIDLSIPENYCQGYDPHWLEGEEFEREDVEVPYEDSRKKFKPVRIKRGKC